MCTVILRLNVYFQIVLNTCFYAHIIVSWIKKEIFKHIKNQIHLYKEKIVSKLMIQDTNKDIFDGLFEMLNTQTY